MADDLKTPSKEEEELKEIGKNPQAEVNLFKDFGENPLFQGDHLFAHDVFGNDHLFAHDVFGNDHLFVREVSKAWANLSQEFEQVIKQILTTLQEIYADILDKNKINNLLLNAKSIFIEQLAKLNKLIQQLVLFLKEHGNLQDKLNPYLAKAEDLKKVIEDNLRKIEDIEDNAVPGDEPVPGGGDEDRDSLTPSPYPLYPTSPLVLDTPPLNTSLLGEVEAPDIIRESIVISAIESLGRQIAMLSSLSFTNLTLNNNLSQQNAVSIQQAINQTGLSTTAKSINMMGFDNPIALSATKKFLL